MFWPTTGNPMEVECYSTRHSPDLVKVGARLTEAKEFLRSYREDQPLAWNRNEAFQGRWYGNATADVCSKLTGQFVHRFDRLPGQLRFLRRFMEAAGPGSFPLLNHYFMVLGDPYYRWAASEFLPRQYETFRNEISRDAMAAELKAVLPPDLEPATVVRYARNLLTALRDNGLLKGRVRKELSVPNLEVPVLGYMVYSLKDGGQAAGAFDGSPVMRSLLRPRELFVPLFRDGERRGYWEFTGDKNTLRFQLRHSGLESWLKEVEA